MGALMGIKGPTPPCRSMFCRMLEKNAGAPGTWVVEYWVKRGYCLHSSARRVVALTAAGFVITVEVKNFGVDEGEDRDLIFVKGDVSIKNETSVNAANPPTVSHCHMKRNLITHIYVVQIQLPRISQPR